jgi:hypothetical protein
MPRSVAQGFDKFLEDLTPTAAQRAAASKHRESVEASLEKVLSVKRYRETGSFHHGTGVRNHCDVDLLVSVGNAKPGSSDTALGWLKSALTATFPSTPVRISRPAVVVDFASGTERWEIIPGFLRPRQSNGAYVYDIPDVGTGWMQSAPVEHLAYVNEANGKAGATGGAKKLSRLAKAWKYYNNVPISSFYLEMRAAHYMLAQSSFSPIVHVCGLLEWLESINLAAMNDPKSVASRFFACSTTAKAADAASKLKTGATRARKARDAREAGDAVTAFHYLDLLFGGNFPAR